MFFLFIYLFFVCLFVFFQGLGIILQVASWLSLLDEGVSEGKLKDIFFSTARRTEMGDAFTHSSIHLDKFPWQRQFYTVC